MIDMRTTLSESQAIIERIESMRSRPTFYRLDDDTKRLLQAKLTDHLLNVLFITSGLSDPDR